MSPLGWGLLAALPWIMIPLAIGWRARDTGSLDDLPADPPPDAPLVSVIIPARDEARNIERCLRSVLASTYAPLEVIVVDDHSTDGTGEIARRLAAEDGRAHGRDRVRVLANPDLPAGWLGKPWACATGAAAARGSILCFTDADTHHGPELLARSVRAMRARDAALFSIAGRQELGSFWERVVQPQVFSLLLARFGSAERVTRSRRASEKIANGQFILVRRDAYDAIGGHAAVRDRIAEDLMLAQRFFAAGHEVALAMALNHFSTRMYTSLGELVRGWRKNILVGGVESMSQSIHRRPLLAVAYAAAALALLVPPLVQLAPLVGLAAWAGGGAGPAVGAWGAIGTAATLAWWTAVYISIDESPLYALVYPLGAVTLLWIVLTAVARGRRVAWKGREYLAQ